MHGLFTDEKYLHQFRDQFQQNDEEFDSKNYDISCKVKQIIKSVYFIEK